MKKEISEDREVWVYKEGGRNIFEDLDKYISSLASVNDLRLGKLNREQLLEVLNLLEMVQERLEVKIPLVKKYLTK